MSKGLAPARPRRVVLRVPRLRLRFPNLVDRYVLKQFASILVLVWLSATALGVIADLTGNIDDILKNNPPAGVIARYYEYLALQMSYDIPPIAVLVTKLVTFSLLSRSNEVTALRSLGISLFRLSLPAIAGATGLALLCTMLQISVLPASNQKLEEANDHLIKINEVANGKDYQKDNIPEFFAYEHLSKYKGRVLWDASKYVDASFSYKGWFDPCHMGFWDFSGRYIPGVNSPQDILLPNLKEVTSYRWISKSLIEFRP